MNKTKYHIEIKTADQYLAGTDANIFIKLYGASDISPEIRLNGYISGNAFERNNTDRCTIEVDDDCDDIYMISIRSDCMYAGSDWLCDYISVQREDGAVVKFQLPSGFWIEDEAVHNFHATSGYDYDLPEHSVNWKKTYGACHYIPPNIAMNKTISSNITIDVNTSEVNVIKTASKAAVNVEAEVIKAALELQIESSLSKQVDNKLHKETVVSTQVCIPASENERTLQEIWTECDYTFSAKLGSDTYNFSVPKDKVFSGFKEIKNMWGDNVL